jgi:hypothetical protein
MADVLTLDEELTNVTNLGSGHPYHVCLTTSGSRLLIFDLEAGRVSRVIDQSSAREPKSAKLAQMPSSPGRQPLPQTPIRSEHQCTSSRHRPLGLWSPDSLIPWSSSKKVRKHPSSQVDGRNSAYRMISCSSDCQKTSTDRSDQTTWRDSVC